MNLNEIYKVPPTVRLYNVTPYQQQGQARVLYVEDNLALFDKTIFYAESGGQIYDTGFIHDQPVISVKKYLGDYSQVNNPDIYVPAVKVNTRIVHEFNSKVDFRPGDVVNMQIDWQRRYQIMKHHTLAHFLFYAMTELFKKNATDMFLKGCSINEEKGGFSLHNKLSAMDLSAIDHTIRSVFSHHIEIAMVAEKTNNEVYYWIYKDIVIPCGGTHVKNTSELADFKIWRKSEGKNKTKIYIKEVPLE